MPALALTTHYGIGFIEVASLSAAICYAVPLWRGRTEFFGPARWIVTAFAVNLIVAASSSFCFGFAASSIDNVIRQFLAMAAIGLVVFTRPQPQWMWYGLFTGSIGTAALAFYQRFGLHMDRADGFHHAILFGDIAMAMGLMSLASIKYFAKTRWAIVPYIAFLSGFAGSILSGSRGGWIFASLALIPLYVFGTRSGGRKTVAVIAASFTVLVVVCLMPQFKVGQRLAEIAADIQQYEDGNSISSVGERLEMWRGATKMFAEHPLIGVGRSNFNAGLNALIDRGEISSSVRNFYHAHNEILHALATQGIVGGIALLLIYVAPLVFFLRIARRRNAAQPYALAGLLLSLSFIGFGLSQVLFAHHIGAIFYALMTAVLAGLCMSVQREVA